MKRIKYFIWSVLFLSVIIMAPEANAYIIPENDSRIRYFYVFGPQETRITAQRRTMS